MNMTVSYDKDGKIEGISLHGQECKELLEELMAMFMSSGLLRHNISEQMNILLKGVQNG